MIAGWSVWLSIAWGQPAAALDARWEAARDGAVWRSPDVSERVAVRDAMRLLGAATDPCSVEERARAMLAPVDLVVERIDGEPALLVVREGQERRGAGLYVLRCGPASPWVWQAPHSLNEAPTRGIARQLFLETGARATMWNTVHRYRSRPEETPGDEVHPADVTRERGSLFHAATLGLAAGDPTLRFVQLHGFAGGALPWDAVVSFGRAERSAVAVAAALGPVLGRVAAWPEDVDVLGGTVNVQGQDLARSGDRFLHVELSPEARAMLFEGSSSRLAFAAALSGAW